MPTTHSIREFLHEPKWEDENVLLQFFKNKGTHLSLIKEVTLKMTGEITACFSEDGKYLAIGETCAEKSRVLLFHTGLCKQDHGPNDHKPV